MALSDDEVKKCLDILKALDEAIAQGPWENSLFFRGVGKKLCDARERFIADLELEEVIRAAATPESSTPTQPVLDPKFTEAYIALYQAEGNNIVKWEGMLSSLAGLSVSRPAYQNEEDIMAMIRGKAYKINDAYVAVRVLKDYILKPTDDTPPVDRFGRALLTLREGAIRGENIVRFMHVSGQYKFVNGKLIKQII